MFKILPATVASEYSDLIFKSTTSWGQITSIINREFHDKKLARLASLATIFELFVIQPRTHPIPSPIVSFRL